MNLMRTDNKNWTVILEVDSNAYFLYYTTKLYVGINICPVYDNFHLRMCYKCCQYGHTKKCPTVLMLFFPPAVIVLKSKECKKNY